MQTVYLETTVIGHLVGRLRSDPVSVGRQTSTRAWWPEATGRYQLLISQLVLDECGAGDPEAAAERLAATAHLDLLAASEEVDRLAELLTRTGAVPPSEPRDAFHIAIAAVNGIDYLATWNFKHIANATLRSRIESVCREAGYEPPLICTPEELLGA